MTLSVLQACFTYCKHLKRNTPPPPIYRCDLIPPLRARDLFAMAKVEMHHPHLIGPILWGHSGPLCHALSLSWTSILHCHLPGVATVARRLRCSYSWLRLILVVVSTVATPGEWQCKIRTGGVLRLAVANGPNIFQMLPLNLH